MTAPEFAPTPAVESTTYVQKPAKLMRIASVAKAMLEEARDTPCDVAGCARFRAIYERTLDELDSLLSDDLRRELSHLRIAFDDPSPSPSELRVAQAELVGWLEGLFGGISASIRHGELDIDSQSWGDAGEEPDSRPMPGQYI